MAAFFDATCPKCKKRFGWTGELPDRPPCPGCGYEIPKEQLENDAKEIEAFKEILRKRKSQEAICAFCGEAFIFTKGKEAICPHCGEKC